MTTTALIVSPDSDVGSEYTRHVGALGFRVHRAESLSQARDLLAEVQPDVVVTSLRLKENNGIHLAHLAHTVLPSLPVVVVGYDDVVLEAEAESAGAFYIVTNDGGEVAAAVQQAVLAKRPQRQWPRKRPGYGLNARLAGVGVRLIDVSYGGFRAEVRNADLSILTRALELELPDSGVTVAADPVWTMTGLQSPAYVFGAAVTEEHAESDSGWRRFVDSVHSVA